MSFLTNPIVTFFGGTILTIMVLALLLTSCSPSNNTKQAVEAYRAALKKGGSPAGVDEVKRFTDFLQNLDSKEYIRRNTSKVYSDDAYLNDTLITHHGAKEIEEYFVKTADTMTQFELIIDDTFQSKNDHYVRWTMIFTAPALGKGEPIHSIGMSQIRFNSEGKVVFHQDFWDSGANIFGQAPVSGSIISVIRKRIQK